MAPHFLRAFVAALAFSASSVAGFPHPAAPGVNGSWPFDSELGNEFQERDDKPFYLRIAPLGASITHGYLSSDGNGYRKYLRDQLRLDGWPVNMVGTTPGGTMRDNDNEGHLGYRIEQITNTAVVNIDPMQPNLILINLGTNDAAQDFDVAGAPDRMITLLEKLFNDIPGTTIILSTLLPNKDGPTNSRVDGINVGFRTTVMDHFKGSKLALADMNDGFFTMADLNDATHPTDYGYKKMASVWYAAFKVVDANGWLSAPKDTGSSDTAQDYTCPKVYGHGRGNIQIQKGSGTDDGNYVHNSEDQGRVFTFPFYSVDKDDADGGFSLDGVFFAQLVNAGGNPNRGGEVDEIIYVSPQDNGQYRYSYWTNNNDNNFGDRIDFEPGFNCPPAQVRFADFNNNGLDDFICLDEDGNMGISLNLGGSPPDFHFEGLLQAKAPPGYTPDLIHVADMDGDGRADYCILSHPGDVICQRNGGSGALPTRLYDGFWQDFSTGGTGFTTMFPSQNRGNAAGVNLVDINGDFKADWLFMDETGHIDTFINNRGTGDGMVPDWRSAGATHGGLSSFGVTDANKRVKFGRMYGTGRRDYIWVEKEKVDTTANSYRHHLHIWKNLGAGGTTLKGDGSNYCDMTGDGYDDYIWIGPNGEIDIYVNKQQPPYWDNHLGVTTLGVVRKTIHVADLDGDGKCDFLSVDKASGSVRMWLNTYDGGSWSFKDHGIVSGSAGCTEGYGPVENDLGVRFADLTGDGKADYLCIETSGRVTGYLNRGMGSDGKITFEDVGQIKLATGYDRQNTRFNDVNGDGKADLLWISKYTGDTTVWYNRGEIPTSGSHFKWDIQGALYEGWDRGSNMHFGALGGQHRADIIEVVPRTNIAYVSYNECPGTGSGGDDPNMGDPDLPAYNPGTAPPPSNIPGVGSYIAFGDSFAAGMGTGTTSTDKCRVGSNNFGNLLFKWLNGLAGATITYQKKQCSGDTLVGINKQIDAWENPTQTDMATISVGGNDLNFSSLVLDCIVTPNPTKTKAGYRTQCEKDEQSAYDYLNDQSADGLRAKLAEAYKKIVRKAGRGSFHLYVPSYLGFFNHDDTDCDHTTFQLTNPHYQPIISPLDGKVYLTTGLRLELNNLVGSLNVVISGAVDDTNQALGTNQAHFVDIQPRFDTHRWCEAGNFHEPDADRDETYFFLTAWNDVPIDEIAVGVTEAAQDKTEIDALAAIGSIPMPNGSDCRSQLGVDPDPYDVYLCIAAEAITDDPNGFFAQRLAGANAALASGNFTSEDIPWYLATKQIKTFHPRSPGHIEYRNAILAKMREVGQIN